MEADMPLGVAKYLRHLATRCARIANDTDDRYVAKELVIISDELVERARALELASGAAAQAEASASYVSR